MLGNAFIEDIQDRTHFLPTFTLTLLFVNNSKQQSGGTYNACCIFICMYLNWKWDFVCLHFTVHNYVLYNVLPLTCKYNVSPTIYSNAITIIIVSGS